MSISTAKLNSTCNCYTYITTQDFIASFQSSQGLFKYICAQVINYK